MILELVPDVKRLSPTEKWMLVEEIWDELVPRDEDQRDAAIVRLIEHRMAEHGKNPASASTWEQVKGRLQHLKSCMKS